MPSTLVLHINSIDLPFQEAGVPESLPRLCTSAQPCLRRIYHIRRQTACPLHGKRTCPKGQAPQVACDRLAAGAAPTVPDGLWRSPPPVVIRRTGENSRGLVAVVFCHIIADVTSRVTWREEAFNTERSKLGERDRRQNIRHRGPNVYDRENQCVCVCVVLLWRHESE